MSKLINDSIECFVKAFCVPGDTYDGFHVHSCEELGLSEEQAEAISKLATEKSKSAYVKVFKNFWNNDYAAVLKRYRADVKKFFMTDCGDPSKWPMHPEIVAFGVFLLVNKLVTRQKLRDYCEAFVSQAIFKAKLLDQLQEKIAHPKTED